MSTGTKSSQPEVIEQPLGLRELTELLIRHYNLHEGLYELLVEFQIGMGVIGPNPHDALPGATVGLSKLGLMKVQTMGNNTLDASAINPVTKIARKRSTIAAK